MKYGGTLAHGVVRGVFEPHDTDSAILWRDFGSFYEAVRSALETELRAPVVMHQWLWPPPFLVWLSSTAFAAQSDVHFDPHAAPYYDKELQQYWAASAMPRKRCHWDQQYTLIAALQAPASAAEDSSFGVDLWSYANSDGGGVCSPSAAAASPECVRRRSMPYEPGKLVMFPSARFHASVPWRQAYFGADPRIIMVAFVVPCVSEEQGGQRGEAVEYQLLGSLGGSGRAP